MPGKVKARVLVPGDGVGEAVLVEALSFYGEVDPEKGVLVDGRPVRDRVLVIGRVRGSTVGSYIVYGLRYYGNAPKAIIVESEADPIVLVGAIIAGIPLYDRARGITGLVRDGVRVSFARDGTLTVLD